MNNNNRNKQTKKQTKSFVDVNKWKVKNEIP